MTTLQFREQPHLVQALRHVLNDSVFQLWWEAMLTENPALEVAPKDVTPQGAHIMLGEQTGWWQFQNRFLLGTQLVEKQADDRGEQTYLPAEPAAEQPE